MTADDQPSWAWDPSLDDEDDIYRAAGFAGPQRFEVPGPVVQRSMGEIVAAVHSLSWAAPHLFGDRLTEFDCDLRRLLDRLSTNDSFTEHTYVRSGSMCGGE